MLVRAARERAKGWNDDRKMRKEEREREKMANPTNRFFLMVNRMSLARRVISPPCLSPIRIPRTRRPRITGTGAKREIVASGLSYIHRA